eukprot:Blabericola_migrator_1__1725@NODE_1464_length_4502_cov_13_265614_g964_i0_p1_GENE_NODE_1464_length_4502_cov_13_265614_g964_i0NODE_1464_length_4502_cov_13_265614_g964_i0_p1_ORF_typecomplete_len475_score34_01_NODE_1464_length_4502_cov_13_265614_g964_i011212545
MLSEEETSVVNGSARDCSLSEEGSYTCLPAEQDLVSHPPSCVMLGIGAALATILPVQPPHDDMAQMIWPACLLTVAVFSPLLPVIGLRPLGVLAAVMSACYNLYLYVVSEWSVTPTVLHLGNVFILAQVLLWVTILVTLSCVASALEDMRHLSRFAIAFSTTACVTLAFKFIMLSRISFLYKEDFDLMSPCASVFACAFIFAGLPNRRKCPMDWTVWARAYLRTLVVLNDRRFLAILFSVFGISLAKATARLLPHQYHITGLADSLFFELFGQHAVYFVLVPLTLAVCNFKEGRLARISGNLLTLNILINGLLILTLVSLSMERLALNPAPRRHFESFDFQLLYQDLFNSAIICLPISLGTASETILFISLLWFMSHFCPVTHISQAWAWLVAMRGFGDIFVTFIAKVSPNRLVEIGITAAIFLSSVAVFASLIFVSNIPPAAMGSFMCAAESGEDDDRYDDNYTNTHLNTTSC